MRLSEVPQVGPPSPWPWQASGWGGGKASDNAEGAEVAADVPRRPPANLLARPGGWYLDLVPAA